MKYCPLLLALLIVLPHVWAEEDDAPEPALPGALTPGAAADYRQAQRGDRLSGTVKYRVEPGEDESTIRLHHVYATADLGPLTYRSHLVAVLDVAGRKLLSFTYRGRSGTGEVLRLLARLDPDDSRPGRLVHRRLRYSEKGEPKETRKVVKAEGLWVPDLLEPFVLGLLDFSKAQQSVRVMDVLTGRISTVPVKYSAVGEGEMTALGGKVACRIFARIRKDERTMVYCRKSDLLPVRHGPAGISLPEKKEPELPKTGDEEPR